MKEYVIVFASPVDAHQNNVLLILKDRPEWQKGKFNLPGGKMEEGETPIEAAVRELKEEAGLEQISDYDPMVPMEPKVMGRILDVDEEYIVHAVKVPVCFRQPLKPQDGETEVVSWHDWSVVKDDKRLITNLRLTVPLMMADVDNWSIRDRGLTVFFDKVHTITVSLEV
jgi:8-oxo-dGTP pyrophosphatase MutT (NUDIX family)